MSETEEKKRIKEWRTLLRSGDESVIISSIEKLRTAGNKELIHDIVSILKTKPGENVETTIFSFLNDLKDQECVDEYMGFVQKNYDGPYRKQLISACWQNGLNYSKYLSFFTKQVLSTDFEVSIEAFSVVEENVEHLSPLERRILGDEIRSSIPNVSKDKTALVKELLSVIDIASGPFKLDLE